MRLMELRCHPLHSFVRLPALQRLDWQEDYRSCPIGRVHLGRARVAQRERRSERSSLLPFENKPRWTYIGPWCYESRLDLDKCKRSSERRSGNTHPPQPTSFQSKPNFIKSPSSCLVLCGVCAVVSCTLAYILIIFWTVGLAAAEFYFV